MLLAGVRVHKKVTRVGVRLMNLSNRGLSRASLGASKLILSPTDPMFL